MLTGQMLVNEITETKLSPDQAAFWWLGQIGYAIKLAGRIIYIDAYLCHEETRVHPPVIEKELIDNADIVVGTHDHLDHIDYETWQAIAANCPDAVFVCPQYVVGKLSAQLGIPIERFCGINDGDVVEVKGIKFTGIAGAHEKLDYDALTGLYPYMAYGIEAEGICLFHAGDTCIYEGFETKVRKLGKIHAAFVPINGRDSYKYTHRSPGNMTWQEAVDLCGNLEPDLAVPAHYDMHAINLHNPFQFEHYIRVKWPGIDTWIGQYGERVLINREKSS